MDNKNNFMDKRTERGTQPSMSIVFVEHIKQPNKKKQKVVASWSKILILSIILVCQTVFNVCSTITDIEEARGGRNYKRRNRK